MKKVLILILVLIGTTACSGGVGGSNPGPAPTNIVPPVLAMLPLNVSLHDLNNNQLNTIDVYKVGSTFKYKLTFTNPNFFMVSTPKSNGGTIIGAESNWIYANNKSTMPGTFGEISGTYYKTTNADDCLNITQLQHDESCSFYTIARNVYNTTTTESFTYPVSYQFNQIADPNNKLLVEQCTWKLGNNYDCSNESKPGYSNQFIKYSLVSTKESFTLPGGYTNSIYTSISGDGHTGAFCNDLPGIQPGGPCTKQRIVFNSSNNTLTYTNLNTFSINKWFFGAKPNLPYDGSSVWVTAYQNANSSYLFNSNIDPLTTYFGLSGDALLEYSEIVNGVDGSFWFDDGVDFSTPRKFKFNFATNKLQRITIAPNYVYGITADGTLIGTDANYNIVCANSIDGINNVSRPMTNFVVPNTYSKFIDNSSQFNRVRVVQVHNQFYGYMDLTVNKATGESYPYLGGYFKITADSTHCAIEPNDPNVFDPTKVTFDPFIHVFDDYVWTGSKVTSSANSAIGF